MPDASPTDPSSVFEQFKLQVRSEVEVFLDTAFSAAAQTEVCRVAKYVTLGGGHRWRAILAVAAGVIFDRHAFRINVPFASSVELAHAASLLIDDLPSMDDAEMRRGKPCAHRVFQRWAVDLSPVFLITMAYQLSLQNPLPTPERRVASALELSRAACQMVHGQVTDVTQPSGAASTLGDIEELYARKSGSLYAATAKAGGILCGAEMEDAARLESCGLKLGLAYQFLDDVADVVADRGTIGKDVGKDRGRVTAVDLFGVTGTTQRARGYEEEALQQLVCFGREADHLRALVKQASWAAS